MCTTIRCWQCKSFNMGICKYIEPGIIRKASSECIYGFSQCDLNGQQASNLNDLLPGYKSTFKDKNV